MTFDIAAFRTAFPEFASTEIYPTQLINLWVAVAASMVSECIWKNMWVTGVSLYVAHELVIATQNQRAAQVGGSPGLPGGVPTDKTVGGVSVTYDPQTTTEKDAGWWNLSTYGKQFIRLARIFGTRPVQL